MCCRYRTSRPMCCRCRTSRPMCCRCRTSRPMCCRYRTSRPMCCRRRRASRRTPARRVSGRAARAAAACSRGAPVAGRITPAIVSREAAGVVPATAGDNPQKRRAQTDRNSHCSSLPFRRAPWAPTPRRSSRRAGTEKGDPPSGSVGRARFAPKQPPRTSHPVCAHGWLASAESLEFARRAETRDGPSCVVQDEHGRFCVAKYPVQHRRAACLERAVRTHDYEIGVVLDGKRAYDTRGLTPE